MMANKNSRGFYLIIFIIVFQLAIFEQCLAFNYINLAQDALENNDTKKAIHLLKSALKENPENSQARFFLGRIYFNIGNYLLADKELSKAHGLDKDNPEIAIMYAELLLTKKEYSKIKDVLFFEYENLNLEAKRLVILGYTYMAENNLSDAKALFENSIKLKPDNDAYGGLIKIALLENNNKKAHKLIEQRLKLNPNLQDILLLKALLAKKKHQYKQALKIYDDLITENPENYYALLQRAEVRIIENDCAGASSDIAPILKINEYHVQANYLLAQCKMAEQDYAAAKKLAQKVLDISSQHFSARLILGLANMQLGYYNQAEKYLIQYLSVYPDNINVQNFLANVYLAQNRPEQAIQVLESIADNTLHVNTSALLTLGGAYLATGEYSKGLDLLNKVKKLSPEQYRKKTLINDQYIKAYITLATIAEKKGDTQNVELLLKRGYEESRNDFKSHFTMAVILARWLFKHKETKKLLQLTDELLTTYPDKTKVKSFQAQVLITTGELKQAEQILKKIIRDNNEDIQHRLLLAKLLSKQTGREQEVLQLLDQMIAIMPEQAYLLVLKTSYLIQIKQYSQAIVSAQQLQEKFPELSIGKQLEGDALFDSGEPGQALALYKETYQINAANSLLSKMVAIMRNNGQEQEAIGFLQTVIEKNSNNASAHSLLADIYLHNKNYDKAANNYELILKTEKNNAMVLNNLAWVYLQQNNPESVILAKKAYDIKPQSAEILDTYGYILLKQGQITAALKLLEKAASIEQKENNIQFHLAEAYYASGHVDKAKQILEKITQPTLVYNEKPKAVALYETLTN